MKRQHPTTVKALRAIKAAGIILVYPLKNARDPPSLWHALYPRSEMTWSWDDTADDRVVKLWHLREELSRSNQVVYTKWFRGRATFFSREVFRAMLRVLDSASRAEQLEAGVDDLYQCLLNESPQTPKQLREQLDLTGRANSRAFDRRLAALWKRLLAVGYGEVDEGAFPALAVGATKHLFESLWDEAQELTLPEAEAIVLRHIGTKDAFARYLKRCAPLAPRLEEDSARRRQE